MRKMTGRMAASAIVLGFVVGAAPALAGEITVMSWGGAYTKSQVEAYQKPWMAETGHTINSVDADNPATPIKAQVEAGNVTVDVADVEYSDAVRFCDEGLLEIIENLYRFYPDDPTGSDESAELPEAEGESPDAEPAEA